MVWKEGKDETAKGTEDLLNTIKWRLKFFDHSQRKSKDKNRGKKWYSDKDLLYGVNKLLLYRSRQSIFALLWSYSEMEDSKKNSSWLKRPEEFTTAMRWRSEGVSQCHKFYRFWCRKILRKTHIVIYRSFQLTTLFNHFSRRIRIKRTRLSWT